MPETNKASDPFGTQVANQDSLVLDIGVEEGEVYDATSELPPAGMYQATCIHVERKLSKNERPYIQFTYALASAH